MFRIIRIALLKNGFKRAEFLKRQDIFANMGEYCFWQPRNIPPEAKMISIGNNVVIASEVLFVNHDVMHHVFNKMNENKNMHFRLNLGAIDIENNVFIGSRCTILPGTKIENNVIIGAGAVVTGKILRGGVYAGVPAKRIGEFEDVMQTRKLDYPELRQKTERFSEEWEKFKERYGENK